MTLSRQSPDPANRTQSDANGEGEQPARQVAALVWRPRPVEPDVLLVTSRTTRRWVLPKGWPMDGLSTAQSAAQEAFEEAGVIAAEDAKVFGTYQYDKVLNDGSLLACTVDVFAFSAIRLADEWPEMLQRKRRWYGAHTAASLVAEPDLAELLRNLADAANFAPVSS